ncbi:N-acetylneuraminate synthase [Nitrospina watsonii]|uniref:N,N'-diacetyllegionaminic acid synthase n=1 Tax=Nitrospina watsonii TaxID=1323948 RepID=A0ABM9HA42_9BACT|nr:N-acetylneuraminate synthase [Nitrospina watsonii]CAI2716999.1 N,N'-diacetyllegionaminic acid synthase [Nitrospina watsonii]
MVEESRCFIIAEAGVNHNGDERLAFQLIEAAANAGADAVKFQTFRAEKLATPKAQTTGYQKHLTGHESQFELLKKLELSPDFHHQLKQHSEKLGLEFMSTPFDHDAADFLVKLGMKRFKVPSGEITNLPFLEHIASKGLPIILSTGMATLEEVHDAVEAIRATRARLAFPEALADMLTILHCTSNYPAAFSDVHLNAMVTLHAELSLPVGYSDHTVGTLLAPVAVSLGATVIEKHYTLDRRLPGPDHAASLEPDELKELVHHIRSIEEALGSKYKQPTATELPVRDVVRKSVTLARALKAGSVVTADDLVLLRPGTGIPPKEMGEVIGKKLRLDCPAFHTLCWPDLEP